MINISKNLGNKRCCYVNSVGPTGPQGEIGLYGSIGQIGITGASGPTGPQGTVGICYKGGKGPQGLRGPQGGLTGNAGPLGHRGEPGSLGHAKNINFEFLVNTSYTNTFVELTNLINNNIDLDEGTYFIQFEINENWADIGAQYYIALYDTINTTIYYTYVFNPTNGSYIVLTMNDTKLIGTANDIVIIPTFSTYKIKIFQRTVIPSTIINITNKNVKFSITFVKL